MDKFYKKKIRCSIIIPTWCRAKKLFFLIKKLEKICSKIFLDYEILVCDSNSSDDTRNLKKKFKSVKIKHYHSKFNSISSKRNLGIKKSIYEDLIFFDDDCIPNLNLLSKFALYLSRKEKREIYFGKYYTSISLINKSNFWYFRNRQNEIVYHNLKQVKKINFTKIITGNMSFNKEIIKKYNLYFNENINLYGCEDTEWGYRLENFGFEFTLVNAHCIHNEMSLNIVSFLKKWEYMGAKSTQLLKKYNFECYKKTNFFYLEKIYKKFIFLSGLIKISHYLIVNFLKKTDKYKFLRIYTIFKLAILISFIRGINLRKKNMYF